MPSLAPVDAAAAQLQHELHDAVARQLASPTSTSRRPILHHLNADSSWLVQLPVPEDEGQEKQKDGKQRYFNVLIDPWLAGTQSDVASWFSRQWHAEPSAVGSIADVEQLIIDQETEASGINGAVKEPQEVQTSKARSPIDAVVVSHEFTDHCHKATLLEVNRSIPVFAIREAATLIKKWKHFETVVTIPSFPPAEATTNQPKADWRATSLAPLPPWLGISRLVQTEDVLNYHAAIVIVFSSATAPEQIEEAEAILYTPHGVEARDVAAAAGLGAAGQQAAPKAKKIQALALLHGLHRVRVGTAGGKTALQSNLGAHNGLAVQRALQARYWIGTHDEVKKGGGLVGWFLHREVLGIKEAIDAEREKEKDRDGTGISKIYDEAMNGVNWVDLGNGDRMVLT